MGGRTDWKRAVGRAAAPLPVQALSIEKSKSLADFAYAALRSAIHEGRLEPGWRLRESIIADWLGISRTPVREAFRRMISEGLLVSGSGNGVAVVEPDQQDLIELYAVREVLEGLAARLAAQQASEAEVRFLWDIYEQEEAAQNESGVLPQINADLHRAIDCAAHNRHLLQSLGSLDTAIGILRYSTFVIPGSAAAAHKQHLDIIRAIDQRDPDAAEAVGRDHVRQSLRIRLKLTSRKS